MAKHLGQVFTPHWVVSLVLDRAGLDGGRLLSSRVLEPSCGDGAFLVELADRLVSAARVAGLGGDRTAALLAGNLVGADLDGECLEAARHQLDALASAHGLPPVAWDLRHLDTLAWAKSSGERFDAVAGNPPYVRIHDLPAETRELLRREYATCRTGMTDTYVAFYEAGLGLLAPGGVLAYIAPNSFLRNAAARSFRRLLLDGGQLRELLDFGDGLVFPDAGTYTAIAVMDADGGNGSFSYFAADAAGGPLPGPEDVPLGLLDDGPWVLPPRSEAGGTRVGDLVRVQYGVATLADRLYFADLVDFSEDLPAGTALFRGLPVETALLRNAAKVSTHRAGGCLSWGLWPYREAAGGGVEVIPEEEMAERYPYGYAYFSSAREALLSRDLHSPKAFYEYGRSQALAGVALEKLLVSPVVPPEGMMRAALVPGGTVAYSGFYAAGGHDDLLRVKAAVEAPEFADHARRAGKPMRGGWRALNAAMLREYRIPD